MTDFGSDTATRPGAAMRRAMAEAVVGDEQRREDPTVTRLEEMIAPILGQEAAVFLPSATMANAIAFKVHIRPGEEVILETWAHPANFEGGGPAGLAGASLRLLPGRCGIFTAQQVEEAIRPDDPHFPRTRLVSVEQTTNIGGGAVWSLEQVKSVVEVARRHGLRAHLDGARLMNAQMAAGVPAARFGSLFDSVTLCFSKGLGAPVGAVTAGSRAYAAEARRLKHMLGGAMRQAGVLAAACLYALEHHVDRLAEDHANARLLGQGLAAIPGITLDPPEIQSNMVFFRVDGLGLTSREFVAELLKHGVRMGSNVPPRIRAVTHLDVDRAAVDRALEAARAVADAARGAARR
ncbi:MAG: aminotransferase class I/II-fold pyridoxal phosphate-dependent enzyme [Candidatus Eisenbacteria bacterium]|nr:aminotransferase class I/II-fold pyridoxal phosphate-dependent enzyme [Candidatus Eisenbacteria bacterium]